MDECRSGMPLFSPSSVLLRTQSDERLVGLARTGSERAFEAIVERYRGPLLRGARRYLPEARAEDALQQAFISAWTAIRRGDEVRDLRAWLYRIVHNTALNQLRVAGYDYAELEESLRGTPAPQEEIERRVVVRQTLTGLAALPDRQREALLLLAVEGRSQDEVARELGVSEGAVRQLVHRARMTLRAAATAVVPMPLAEWAATASAASGDVSASMAERIAELVGGAGASAVFAKAGAVAVLATTAVAGPALVSTMDRAGGHPARPARDASLARPAARQASSAQAALPARAGRLRGAERRGFERGDDHRGRGGGERSGHGSGRVGSGGPGPGRGSGSSGRGSSGSSGGSGPSSHSGSGSSGTSGGSSGSSGSGSGSSGSGSDDRSGSSGDGSGSDDSGSGDSGSSGSGSSGSDDSGSSGSGSSGSGDSGSSGSGTSGGGPGPSDGSVSTDGSGSSGGGPGPSGGSSETSGSSGTSGSGDSGDSTISSGSGSSGSSGSGSSGSGSSGSGSSSGGDG